MAPSISTFSQLGYGTDGGAATNRLDFLSGSAGAAGSILNSDGMRGTLDRGAEQTRDGLTTYPINITHHPKPAELSTLLPFWGFSGTPFVPIDTLTAMAWTWDEGSEVYRMDGVVPQEIRIRCTEGGLGEVTQTLQGKTVTALGAGTFPSLALSLQPVFAWSDGVFTLGGTVRDLKEIEIIIQYSLEIQHFGSRNPSRINVVDRKYFLNFTVPKDSTHFTINNLGAGGATASYALTIPAGVTGGTTLSWTFAWAKVQVPAVPTEIPQRGEIMLRSNCECKKLGSTAALTMTLDVTA